MLGPNKFIRQIIPNISGTDNPNLKQTFPETRKNILLYQKVSLTSVSQRSKLHFFCLQIGIDCTKNAPVPTVLNLRLCEPIACHGTKNFS